ncbi:uncharacterized protein C18orf63 homolog [Psammomys obesus]|uniref:uncharacterized protein C18orf63 homolog n=1 Tax=Psammomys obesus TaxID=48139 RepID=UPI002452A974|nr:uncharacterized protein C18orf63 homolog [Psammomys obesus]
MNESRQQSLFFVILPDLHKLCAVQITLNSSVAETEMRSTQIKMCRQLLLLHEDILTAPVPGIVNQIWVVMSIPFFKSGRLNIYIEKCGAKMEAPQRVIPVILQNCLSYSLLARLAPAWNRTGHLLVQGRDFLSHTGKQSAVVLDINVTETQVCLSIEVYTIRLPPPELKDFDISQHIIEDFHTNQSAVIERHSILNNWCYVLPSMKMGQIINVLHTAPPDCPFHSFEDFRRHWDDLYGYKLPEDRGGEMRTYCSVYFRMINERTFTYPLTCIRSQPIQFFPRVDLDGVLKSFLSDLKSKLPHLCGFPIKMTNKPCYYTQELSRPQVQENKVKPPNLTTKRLFRAPPTQARLTAWPRAPCCPAPSAGRAAEPEVGQQRAAVFPAGRPRPAPLAGARLSRPPLEQAGLSRENAQVQRERLCSQTSRAPAFVPVFKKKSEQANRAVPAPGAVKRKQTAVTESPRPAREASVPQGGKPSSGAAARKKPNSISHIHVGHLNQPRSGPPQGQLCGRRTGPPSSSERRAVPLSARVTHTSGSSVRNAVDSPARGKDSLTSRLITQILGKSHESLKLKSQPHIFESETGEWQLQQQHLANEITDAGAAERGLTERKAAHSRRRKLCPESSKAYTRHCSDAHKRQPSSSESQVANTIKPEDSLIVPEARYSVEQSARLVTAALRTSFPGSFEIAKLKLAKTLEPHICD